VIPAPALAWRRRLCPAAAGRQATVTVPNVAGLSVVQAALARLSGAPGGDRRDSRSGESLAVHQELHRHAGRRSRDPIRPPGAAFRWGLRSGCASVPRPTRSFRPCFPDTARERPAGGRAVTTASMDACAVGPDGRRGAPHATGHGGAAPRDARTSRRRGRAARSAKRRRAATGGRSRTWIGGLIRDPSDNVCVVAVA
jgi:hypothetical protein